MTGKLNIVHISPCLPPDGRGGLERHVVDLAEVQSSDHQVHIVSLCPDLSTKEINPERRNGYEVWWIEESKGALAGVESSSDEVDSNLSRVLSSLRPDVVHIHHLAGISTNCVRIARRYAGAVIVGLHDYTSLCPTDTIHYKGHLCFTQGAHCLSCLHPGPYSRKRGLKYWRVTNPLLKALWRLHRRSYVGSLLSALSTRNEDHLNALKLADKVIAPSHALAEVYRKWGFDSERLCVIAHGTKGCDRVQRDFTPGSSLRLGFIGSHRTKGLLLLLKAFAELPGTDVELNLYGYMHYPPAVYRQLRPLLKRPNIIWHGSISPDAMDSVYEQMDVLVAPSIWIEPFGLVALEAVSRGVPVIASAGTGFCETVKHEINGLTFELASVSELKNCLQRLIEDQSLLPRLQSNCGRVRSIHEQAQDILALYRTCSSRSSAKRE